MGPIWLVAQEALDVHEVVVAAGATGRPLSTCTAWAASALLEDINPAWLDPAGRSRLGGRLQRPATWETWARWLDRRAARAQRFVIGRADIPQFIADPDVVASEVIAAEHLRLGLSTGPDTDVYIHRAALPGLIQKFFLIPTTRHGGLTVRVVGHDWHVTTATYTPTGLMVPRLMVAADLLLTGGPPAHTAGGRLLGDLVPVSDSATG